MSRSKNSVGNDREKMLRDAEQLVRDVLCKTSGQRVTETVVRDVARKVSNAIPQTPRRR